MGNENEKNEQNPGQQQNNPGNQVDPNRKNPSQSAENIYNPQDPTGKSLARTPVWLIVRTVKDRKRLKSAAHPNRDHGQRT